MLIIKWNFSTRYVSTHILYISLQQLRNDEKIVRKSTPCFTSLELLNNSSFFFALPIKCLSVLDVILYHHYSSPLCLFAFLSSAFLPVYAPHPCLQGHFDNTWCRCQTPDAKLSISLCNGVTTGLCWPLNCLRWRRRPPFAAFVWHCLLAACLFSASRSHFRWKAGFDKEGHLMQGTDRLEGRSGGEVVYTRLVVATGLSLLFSKPVPAGTIKVDCNFYIMKKRSVGLIQ